LQAATSYWTNFDISVAVYSSYVATMDHFSHNLAPPPVQNIGIYHFTTLDFEDNHVSILLELKHTRGIQKESSCDLEATVDLDRGQEYSVGQPPDRRSYNQQFPRNTPTQLLKNSSELHRLPHLPPPEQEPLYQAAWVI
jgi:hypothetical protein